MHPFQELGELPPSLDELLPPMLPYDTQSSGSNANIPVDAAAGQGSQQIHNAMRLCFESCSGQAAQSNEIGSRNFMKFRVRCLRDLLSCCRMQTGANGKSRPRPTQCTWLGAVASAAVGGGAGKTSRQASRRRGEEISPLGFPITMPYLPTSCADRLR